MVPLGSQVQITIIIGETKDSNPEDLVQGRVTDVHGHPKTFPSSQWGGRHILTLHVTMNSTHVNLKRKHVGQDDRHGEHQKREPDKGSHCTISEDRTQVAES